METSFRKRPTRLGQIFQSIRDPLYFVTMVTWRRQPLLARKEIMDAWVARAVFQQTIGVAIGRFVLMPDHLHFFAAIGGENTLSETVKHLKQAITKAARLETPGLRVWQPGFFDHLLRSSESYSEKWRYVRDNPVRARLCTDADNWPFQGEVVRIERR